MESGVGWWAVIGVFFIMNVSEMGVLMLRFLYFACTCSAFVMGYILADE